MTLHHLGFDALMIAAIVVFATIGDVVIAAAMRSIGDLDDIRARSGMLGAIRAVLGNVKFAIGVTFMALSFFSLLFALSNADLSLVFPVSASFTFITNAVAAKIFLKEEVDRRRWIAAVLVCAGVILMAR